MHFCFTILALALPAFAHFVTLDPVPRGGKNTESYYGAPCAGKPVSSTRTLWPANSSAPLSYKDEHAEALTLFSYAYGNDPKQGDFKPIMDQFNQIGLGTFCLNNFKIPNATAGANATIQIREDSHDGGYLYQCIDIQISDDAPTRPNCANGTGVTAEAIPSSTSSASGSSASSSTSGNSKSAAAAVQVVAGSGILVVGLLATAGAWLL
jgi:hypothetical protein